MRAVLRFLFVVPIGFVAACLTGAFAMLWPFLQWPQHTPLTDPLALFQAAVAFSAQTAQIGSVALVPWGVFMVVCELFGLSSVLLHLAAGVAGGVAVIVTAYGEHLPAGSVQTAIVVAAATFSLVYWIVAGHSAGRWRRRRTAARGVDTADAPNVREANHEGETR